MMRRAYVMLVLAACAASAIGALAADAATPGPAPAAAAPPAAKPTVAPHATAGPAAHPTARRTPARHATSRAATTHTTTDARTGAGPRRLEDIHIAGEIPAPQVLFITARDQRRFMDSKHHRYLRTAREVAEATPAPTTVIVTRPEKDPR
ncbi:MAG: hypothetical protein HYR74_02500 [Candidatus Eisenbacteria bacterium]|nr:hypothetical protein [Candidatus Eisenbacteria bacterium]